MKINSQQVLASLRNGGHLSSKEKLSLIMHLSFPSMIAQLASVIMEYIDSGMVGRLGPEATASIGLVMTTLWMVGGLSVAVVDGFTIQTAIAVGAKEEKRARNLIFESLIISLLFGVLVSAAGVAIHQRLPLLVGGGTETARRLSKDAGGYFMIYCLFLPLMILRMLSGGMLRAYGNMRIPGILDTLVCLFDVFFNLLCIYETRTVEVYPFGSIQLFGLGLGVRGAALGTGLAEALTAGFELYFLMRKKSPLHFRKEEKYRLVQEDIVRSFRISLPIAFERLVMNGAQIVYTRIIAPFGVTAIAANSFGVTVECMCYLPGFGVQDAASTLVGQSVGARQKENAFSFGKLTILYGMVLQGALGILMALVSPALVGLLTPDPEVVNLSVRILRIEALVESLYGASIVASGVLRGAEDTFVPSLLNFASVWLVRIPLALLFTVAFHAGLVGVWVAMAVELAFRGTILLIRFARGKWLEKALMVPSV